MANAQNLEHFALVGHSLGALVAADFAAAAPQRVKKLILIDPPPAPGALPAEAVRKIRRLEEEATALQDARVVAADRAMAASSAVVNAFNSAAERIEGITKKLNQTVGNGGVAIG